MKSPRFLDFARGAADRLALWVGLGDATLRDCRKVALVPSVRPRSRAASLRRPFVRDSFDR